MRVSRICFSGSCFVFCFSFQSSRCTQPMQWKIPSSRAPNKYRKENLELYVAAPYTYTTRPTRKYEEKKPKTDSRADRAERESGERRVTRRENYRQELRIYDCLCACVCVVQYKMSYFGIYDWWYRISPCHASSHVFADKSQPVPMCAPQPKMISVLWSIRSHKAHNSLCIKW